MFDWIDGLPANKAEFEKPYGVQQTPKHVCDDWLNWCMTDAATAARWMHALEKEFRKLGITYHAIPYHHRHSMTLEGAETVPQILIDTLAGFFETETPTTELIYFENWNEGCRLGGVIDRRLRETRMSMPVKEKTIRDLWVNNQTTMRDLKINVSKMEHVLKVLRKDVRQMADRWNGIINIHDANPPTKEGKLFREWVEMFHEVLDGERTVEEMVTELIDFAEEERIYVRLGAMTHPDVD